MKERLAAYAKFSPEYIAHEFLNQDWQAMSLLEVSQLLAPAGLKFVGSAQLLDRLDWLGGKQEGHAILQGIGGRLHRETVRDVMVNRLLRRDIYVKGGQPAEPDAQPDDDRQMRFVLLAHETEIPTVFHGANKVAITLSDGLYRPLIEIVAAGGYRAISIAELSAHPLWTGQPISAAFDAVAILIGGGVAAPVQGDEEIAAAKPRCHALNDRLLQRAWERNEVTVLASPVTGGGVALSRFHQFFLCAWQAGERDADRAVRFIDETLKARGQGLAGPGRTADQPEDHQAFLRSLAGEFYVRKLPVLTALGIADL